MHVEKENFDMATYKAMQFWEQLLDAIAKDEEHQTQILHAHGDLLISKPDGKSYGILFIAYPLTNDEKETDPTA